MSRGDQYGIIYTVKSSSKNLNPQKKESIMPLPKGIEIITSNPKPELLNSNGDWYTAKEGAKICDALVATFRSWETSKFKSQYMTVKRVGNRAWYWLTPSIITHLSKKELTPEQIAEECPDTLTFTRDQIKSTHIEAIEMELCIRYWVYFGQKLPESWKIWWKKEKKGKYDSKKGRRKSEQYLRELSAGKGFSYEIAQEKNGKTRELALRNAEVDTKEGIEFKCYTTTLDTSGEYPKIKFVVGGLKKKAKATLAMKIDGYNLTVCQYAFLQSDVVNRGKLNKRSQKLDLKQLGMTKWHQRYIVSMKESLLPVKKLIKVLENKVQEHDQK